MINNDLNINCLTRTAKKAINNIYSKYVQDNKDLKNKDILNSFVMDAELEARYRMNLYINVAEVADQYLGWSYVLGGPYPLNKNVKTADCGSFTGTVLYELGLGLPERSTYQATHDFGSYYHDGRCDAEGWPDSECGDIILVLGDEHIIMSDGVGGDWDAGTNGGVCHRPDWHAYGADGYGYQETLLPPGDGKQGYGYSKTSELIKKHLKNKYSEEYDEIINSCIQEYIEKINNNDSLNDIEKELSEVDVNMGISNLDFTFQEFFDFFWANILEQNLKTSYNNKYFVSDDNYGTKWLTIQRFKLEIYNSYLRYFVNKSPFMLTREKFTNFILDSLKSEPMKRIWLEPYSYRKRYEALIKTESEYIGCINKIIYDPKINDLFNIYKKNKITAIQKSLSILELPLTDTITNLFKSVFDLVSFTERRKKQYDPWGKWLEVAEYKADTDKDIKMIKTKDQVIYILSAAKIKEV